jgi:O-antigen/teichoic acid export membrane protein
MRFLAIEIEINQYMPAETAEYPTMTPAAHRASFFRQSGWLMIANIAAGQLMWGLHFLTHSIPEEEYRLFVILLSVVMCVPTLPLQMVFAHQTARALATHRERELAGQIRLIGLGIFVLWLAATAGVFFLQGPILDRWQITNPASLWITAAVVLLSMLGPMVGGVLQGQQNFLWLGWSMILNGVGRVGLAVIAVLVLGCYSTGMMAGVLFGLVLSSVVCLWQTRAIWSAPTQPFDWRGLLGQVVPLMLGFAAFQFLFTADTIFVGSYFNSGTDKDLVAFYGSAGTLSRALMWLVGPLASVMFPRIVHSAARSEKNNLMGLVLAGTAVLAISGAISLHFLGPWVVRFVNGAKYVAQVSALLPWYAGAMVPLALANVLINNLLARSSFKVVPGLCLLAAAYGFGLNYALAHSHHVVTALKVMAVSNLLLLAICAWHTWVQKPEAQGQALA